MLSDSLGSKKYIIDQQVTDIEMPENLKMNDFLQEFANKCKSKNCGFGYYSFAFGQSPFPVPDCIKKALVKNVDKAAYTPVQGIRELRESIARYNKNYFKLNISPYQVYVGPGTKELIFNLLEILHGTVILPTPSWLGYLPQIRYLKKNFHMLPVRNNGKIDALDLEKLALRLHDRQKILFLNNPNNPTGLVYTKKELEDITAVCRKFNILVVSDEIYAQTTYEFENFTSMAKVYPEGTFVTNGLSKSHSAGGYRLGYVIFPPEAKTIKRHFKKLIAMEYTAISTPIQHAAVAGFEPSKEMDRYFDVTRKIHEMVGKFTSDAFNEIEGVKATKPEATFYLLADFNDLWAGFQARKISTSIEFSEALMQHPYHTAIVAGDSMVLPRNDFSARIAYVQYDGARAMQRYLDKKPKTEDEKNDFVKKSAPKVVAGIKMISQFCEDLKKA